MNFSAWSIRNPVPSLLLFVVLTVAGIIGLRGLGIQNFPDIELPIQRVGVREGREREQGKREHNRDETDLCV